MSFIDFGTAVDLGSQIDFGFTRGSGFSPPSGAFGFGSQPTPTNQGGGLFGNLFGGGSQGALTATLGGLNAGLAADAANRTADAAFAAAQGQLNFLNQARREDRAAALGQKFFDTTFTFGPGADLNFARENRADELRRFRNIRDAQIANEVANSPEARRAAQFQNELAIKRELAGRIGQTAAMFGSSAPVNVSNLVV
jgi:hypothetical protein